MDFYQEEIKRVFESLYPTGRAWNYARNDSVSTEATDAYTDGQGNEFTDGQGNVYDVTYTKSESEIRNIQQARQKSWAKYLRNTDYVLNQLIPDNENFTIDDADSWERVYGINNAGLSLEERKQIILNRITYPNGKKYRQTSEYLQSQLQANGFDLYVHENRIWNGSEFVSINPKASIFGEVLFGEALFGNDGVEYHSVVKNYIDKDVDGDISQGIDGRESYIFFVSGSIRNEFANIDVSRENELRDIILKNKPMHSVALLQITLI